MRNGCNWRAYEQRVGSSTGSGRETRGCTRDVVVLSGLVGLVVASVRFSPWCVSFSDATSLAGMASCTVVAQLFGCASGAELGFSQRGPISKALSPKRARGSTSLHSSGTFQVESMRAWPGRPRNKAAAAWGQALNKAASHCAAQEIR